VKPFLQALSGFEAPQLVERTRQLAMEDEFPRLETQGLLWVGRHDQAGRERAWKFMVAHYDRIFVLQCPVALAQQRLSEDLEQVAVERQSPLGHRRGGRSTTGRSAPASASPCAAPR